MADKIKLNLENCYGIGKLEAELEFKHKGYAIYAPNGSMKTSLAKTMIALSKGNKPEDLAFPERVSICEVIWNDDPIKKEEIFVVKSYDDKYSPDGVSTLLANESLKAKYETIHKDIAEAKKFLDKKMRSLAGYGEKSRENLDPILERIFGQQYYDALLSIKSEIDTLQDEDFASADYTIIFNPKVLDFLKEDTSKANIDDFARKYDELTEKSPILRKDFQYHHVNQVHQQLKSNNFFTAGHTISLCDKNDGNKEELATDSSLLDRIEAEKLRVFSNPDLKQKFDTFNNKLKNKELQIFRDYITQNQHILPELQDLDAFERKLWLQYIYRAHAEYDLLIEKYKKGQVDLAQIISEAQEDRNDWDDVIDDFNRRFLHLPFQLSVENKSDVILKDTAPSIVFNFIDGEDQRQYSSAQRNDLLNVLSTGEARALYILNIMFEVHTRWKVRKKTLFIFDDIADSFDYKNKFAIIDYLDHIIKSEDTNFIAIVLTHNFDFLRTIESREICQANQCYMALRNQGKITLTPFQNRSDIRNPFHKWQSRLNEAEVQIAYIPFLRNVIEYTRGIKDENGVYDTDYLTLTKMLHYKDGTEDLKIQNYKDIFEKHFTKITFPTVDLNKDILGYIKETADACLNQNDGINLEHKIVLSIAIRILAEKFMIEKIRGVDPDYDPTKKQMGNLLQDFKDRFNNLIEDIRLLKRINLITPANIHLNAFMYEPILDMGFGELKKLYQDAKGKF
jgi:hypothetical protein